jgi:hypothetical protein
VSLLFEIQEHRSVYEAAFFHDVPGACCMVFSTVHLFAFRICNKACNILLQAKLFDMVIVSVWILPLVPLQSVCLTKSQWCVRL